MRVILVGTDTDCGKTTIACALLRAARAAGLRALPFKPAASGPAGPGGDPERLLAAAALPGLTSEQLCPLRFAAPIAPGLAEDGALDMSRWTCLEGQGEPAALARVRAALERLEARHAPDLTVIEGAGGLWVPMPGGSWLPPRGFFLTQTLPGAEASHAHNERVIAAASGLECFGLLPYAAEPEDSSWLRPGAWARLMGEG